MRLPKLIILFLLTVLLSVSPLVFGFWASFVVDIPTVSVTLGSLESSSMDFTVSHDSSFANFTGETPYQINSFSHCNQYNDNGECIDSVPSLCPYLSLEPKNEEATEIGFTQNPFSLQATGKLNHPTDDTDKWTLSVKSPCFEGECPANYDSLKNGAPLPQSLKGHTFKCDIEVDASDPPDLVQNFFKQNIAYAAVFINTNTIAVSAVLTGKLTGCTANCFSNVLFLPGLMGSKLYEPDGLSDKELWVSSSDSKQADLALNVQGKSINDVYTKNDTQKLDGDTGETGIVDEVKLPIFPDPNIYKSFIADLKNWKQEGTIADYAFIPYDWRLSLDDIITNGKTSTNNNLSYTASQDFSDSFILKKLEALQSNSKSGKVTIISHSQGGLVAKALVQKLKDTNNPLYDKIDKIIFVAVPQIGTPDAVAALLHGSELGHGFIMYNDRSRQLSENMPTVYNLLPSASYFTTVDPGFAVDKIVSFEDQPFFTPQTSQYGIYVSNATELKNYILGTDNRAKPSFGDTVHPNIGNSTLYTQAETVHQILDSWQPSLNTKVIQVAGWGEETLAGLDYTTEKDVTEHLSYKPRMVVDGDGTVVAPSALWMSNSAPNVERWWVDLWKYNDENFPDRVHKSILEVSEIQDFIKNEIKGSINVNQIYNYVTNNASNLSLEAVQGKRLHYTLHSPLTLGITDSEGRYTGMDPITKEIKQEIPGVIYKQIGEVQFISVPAGIAYTLKLKGYANGFFSLDVDKQTGNQITESISFQGISSSTLTLATMNITPSSLVSTSELKIDQDGNGSVDQIYHIIDGKTQVTIITPRINASGSLNSGGSSFIPTQVVEQPKIETKEDTVPIVQNTEDKKEILENVVVVANPTINVKPIIPVQKKKMVKKIVVVPTKIPDAAVQNNTETPINSENLSASVISAGVDIGFWGIIGRFIYNIFH